MKKFVLILLFVFSLTSVCYAKTLKQIGQEVTIENTATNVETGATNVVEAIAVSPYYITKWVMTALCAPFYWLEKVKKN